MKVHRYRRTYNAQLNRVGGGDSCWRLLDCLPTPTTTNDDGQSFFPCRLVLYFNWTWTPYDLSTFPSVVTPLPSRWLTAVVRVPGDWACHAPAELQGSYYYSSASLQYLLWLKRCGGFCCKYRARDTRKWNCKYERTLEYAFVCAPRKSGQKIPLAKSRECNWNRLLGKLWTKATNNVAYCVCLLPKNTIPLCSPISNIRFKS